MVAIGGPGGGGGRRDCASERGVFRPGAQRAPTGATAAVTRGPLTISVTESGEIEAKESMRIANELNWAVVIKKVVPEGRWFERAT